MSEVTLRPVLQGKLRGDPKLESHPGIRLQSGLQEPPSLRSLHSLRPPSSVLTASMTLSLFSIQSVPSDQSANLKELLHQQICEAGNLVAGRRRDFFGDTPH